MKKFLFLMGLCLAFTVEAKQNGQSTEVIKQKIIQQSIDSYPGNCPCPYNTARNGSRCGKRSAFNLLYAFYNFPKAFHLIHLPLAANSTQLEDAIEQQLFQLASMGFLDTAVKTNPMGEQVKWMKTFIVQAALDMKVRIQTSLL